MRNLTDILCESKEVHPVLCIKLKNHIDKKQNSYAIMYQDGDRWDYALFPNIGNIDGKIFGEIRDIKYALDDCNGDGYKAAVKLDRENDLYEITDEDAKKYMKHIPWFKDWWETDGAQEWIVNALK